MTGGGTAQPRRTAHATYPAGDAGLPEALSEERRRGAAVGAAPMMRVRSASAPPPGRGVNEDLVFRFGPLVGVLDGATVPEGFDTGCVHGPQWYVRHLAARLGLAEAARPAATLVSNLAAAILAIRADHGGQCDLDHPGTPASSVCLLRDGGDQVDYLVLCDSPLVLDTGGRVDVVIDDRLAASMARLGATTGTTGTTAITAAITTAGTTAITTAAAPPESAGSAEWANRFRHAVTRQREQMNRTNGYWVAAADPEAAYHAIVGTLPLRGPDALRRAVLLTDGASAAVEEFGLFDWTGLLDMVTIAGPGVLIDRVRAAERDHPERLRRHKPADDASAVYCEFTRLDEN
ncbi:hypothetical protein SAMN05443287_11463 [Micromonospora phaseoli]|uniref:Protein phosphatase 2C n=1 Tax=Micromonospora phaseoli TaxID=1144548 RepID=A0A1H7DHP7_9ACTN|nr:hypothetical protein [Micromonospora phaseoli]PZW02344.1 hypothetical protein CLV64_102719 [Micromonospora phaseoli]GIJ75654.1 hypothetical protein Xph01_00860 [Micromonospora phaseoli]SEK01351.1 hypothetical protein SAMN05443287_11463 [Micromonospora phaseoli]